MILLLQQHIEHSNRFGFGLNFTGSGRDGTPLTRVESNSSLEMKRRRIGYGSKNLNSSGILGDKIEFSRKVKMQTPIMSNDKTSKQICRKVAYWNSREKRTVIIEFIEVCFS